MFGIEEIVMLYEKSPITNGPCKGLKTNRADDLCGCGRGQQSSETDVLVCMYVFLFDEVEYVAWLAHGFDCETNAIVIDAQLFLVKN